MVNSSGKTARTSKDLVIVPSHKGLQHLPIGSRITLEIQRSCGSLEKFNSVFAGLQPEQGVLFKMPCTSSIKNPLLLEEGNVVTVRGLSTQGVGAIIAFRATITRHYTPPFSMLVTTVPESIQMHLLRNEPRFSLDMEAKLSSNGNSLKGGLEDISLSGCCFACLKDHKFVLDDVIEIELGGAFSLVSYNFTGVVKNVRKKEGLYYLGVSFDDKSQSAVKDMLQELILKGIGR